MQIVKSLLLGSAASLAAVAGAQAADLPVKAKAVEYVKVCSLYGAGFFYIPGTDTCLKIGGFVRTEWNHNAGGSFAPTVNEDAGFYTRRTDVLVNRTRGLLTWDVRSQTGYGTLRSYLRAAWQWTSNTDTIGGSSTAVYLDRAFIQFAGFTFGKTVSFFDVPDIADMTYQNEYARNNTGGSGTPVFAYTAQLGNGVSATISIEDYTERRANVVGVTTGTAFFAGADNPAFNHGNETPDIVGNIRVDQAWGSAQVSGALHLNQATYYTAQPAGTVTAHPDDKWGWAVGAGLLLKMPWDPKDTFAVAGHYCTGATVYCVNTPGSYGARSSAASLFQDGGVAIGWWDDAYFDNTALRGQIELPKVWSVQAGFQHYWTNTLRSSIWGVYSNYEANSNAVDRLICTAAALGFAPGCADWSAWQIGSRTIWNPVHNLDIGLEVIYTKVDTAFAGGRAGACAGAPPCLTGGLVANVPSPVNIQDNDVWSGILRIQRNFWP
jgi:hypothetical protein